jgi:hypothetical protein
MKTSLIILLLIVGSSIYAQTDSIEKAILYKKVLTKELTSRECAKIALKWNESINKVSKYPELPLDQSGQVYYYFLYELKNFTKEKLFNRSLEWLSIKYGIIPYYLYSNLEDGKIILKNSIDLDHNNTCSYSYVITIKNEKILVEFANVGFHIFHEGHYNSEIWIPDQTENMDIKKIYPIISKFPFEWDLYLNMLKITNDHFNNEVVNLCNYIVNYDSVYKF